ncbi:hypothetical protein ACFL6U_16235, partial [Planctomycetota bacterium]
MSAKRIDDHALQVLEFDRVLNLLGSFARTELGKEAARALYPSTKVEWIQRRHTGDITVGSRESVPLAGIRNIRPLIGNLGRQQTLFEPEQLLDIADTLSAATRLKGFLTDLPADRYNALNGLAETIDSFSTITDRIDTCIGPDGVRDSASNKLRDIRKQIRNLQADIRKRFE